MSVRTASSQNRRKLFIAAAGTCVSWGLGVAAPLAAQGTGTPGSRTSAPIRRVMAAPADRRVHGVEAQSTAAARAGRVETPIVELPAFAVKDANDRPLAAASLPPARRNQHWLLLLTTSGCTGCDRVLGALAASTSTRLHEAGRLTVVVHAPTAAGAPAALDRARSAAGNLGNATWTADPDGSAMAALKVKTVPTVLLMEGTRVHTALHGMLGDPQRVAGVAAAWITHEPARSDAGADGKPLSLVAAPATVAPVEAVKLGSR